MRLIHTADWHLGRYFHNVSLVDDQAHLLAQLVDLVRDVRADAVIIAGDVYDRALPPPEAVRLLDNFLSDVAVDLGVPVVVIAGNHDSPERLNFGARLLARTGCHVFARLNAEPGSVCLRDEHGPVHIVGLPYAEPALVRERTGATDVHTHDAAMAHLSAAAASAVPDGERGVLVAHCFVAGGGESESERPLSVGGAGNVSSEHFAPFCYTALGHLHRPQRAGADSVRYSGSLMKYSFSEIDQTKSVTVVDIDASGHVQVEQVSLAPRRDLRLLEGALADLLEGPADDENAEDYLLVRLTDTDALLDPMGRLREVYPNVLHLQRPALAEAAASATSVPRETPGDEQLFDDFFTQVTGVELTATQRAAFRKTLEALRKTQREADA